MKIAVRKRRAPSIIIVSLVDILTILLIFFVVSTTFKKDQPEVQINLPESQTATDAPARDGARDRERGRERRSAARWQSAAGGRTAKPRCAILPAQRKTTLALQADKKASFGTIIKVMDALKLAGREESAGVYSRREMKRPIVKYGDPVLRAKGKRIAKVDDEIRALASDMLETMHAANGVGLAAQQIGEALQLTVLDISGVEDRPSTMKLNGKDVDPAHGDAAGVAQSRAHARTTRSRPARKAV